tara:strand:- start:100 stop:1098 length:999 start_codon:yes stop_codon:yes gene_type:complete
VLNLKGYCEYYGFHFNRQDVIAVKNDNIIFKFKNDFLKNICVKNAIENWVDIENEYYSELKKIANKAKLNVTHTDDSHTKSKKTLVLKLNKEFGEVKVLLKEYFKIKIIDANDFGNPIIKEGVNPFSDYFKLPNLTNFSSISNDLPFSDDLQESYNNLKEEPEKRELLFLNFNYTNSLKGYLSSQSSEIKIHGNLDNMIFGFGDENDDHYSLIEKIDDNEYLRNFKSFQYSLNPNYNNFFEFVEKKKFQVYIMGHSCGLSDKVLLSNIFEHKHCRGIRIFYHQKEDNTDNYLDIVKNISRHFKEKQPMRRKIVNKKSSSPMPQNVRFEKNKQ